MVLSEQDYEEMAVQAIRVYLNKDFTDDYIKKNFKFAILRLISKAKQLDDNGSLGIKSIKEGDSSITYDNDAMAFQIDSDIKALLPTPYIRMY